MEIRRGKDPISNKESDKLTELYEKRAKVEREIFIVETLLKFLPASILTVFISLFYVGNQDIHYWGIHITGYLIGILVAIIIFAALLFIQSSKLYKKKYPIITEIQSYEEDKNMTRLEKLQKQREEVRIALSQDEDAKEERKRIEEKEIKLIPELQRIIDNYNDPKKRKSLVIDFRNRCSEPTLRNTVNPRLIGKVIECIKFMSLSDLDNFKELAMGIKYLITHTQNEEHFHILGKQIHDIYNKYLKQIQKLPTGNIKINISNGALNDFIHTYVNICNKEEFKKLLELFIPMKDEISGMTNELPEIIVCNYFVINNFSDSKDIILALHSSNSDNPYYSRIWNRISAIPEAGETLRSQYFPSFMGRY